MARKRRGLSAGDRALWAKVAETVAPLDPDRRAPRPPADAAPTASAPPPATSADPASPASPRVLRPLGRAARHLHVPEFPDLTPAPIRRATPGLDRATARRMTRGLRAPDARLDLHGLTMERAHAALSVFLGDAQARGLRCVLVVTGKGRDDRGARGEGVLRRSVPRWLETPALRGLVTGVYEAHPRHGGAGALYVMLRKRR